MSVIKVTKADLWHVAFVIEWAKWVLDEYPELLNKEEEDAVKVVDQLLQETME